MCILNVCVCVSSSFSATHILVLVGVEWDWLEVGRSRGWVGGASDARRPARVGGWVVGMGWEFVLGGRGRRMGIASGLQHLPGGRDTCVMGSACSSRLASLMFSGNNFWHLPSSLSWKKKTWRPRLPCHAGEMDLALRAWSRLEGAARVAFERWETVLTKREAATG